MTTHEPFGFLFDCLLTSSFNVPCLGHPWRLKFIDSPKIHQTPLKGSRIHGVQPLNPSVLVGKNMVTPSIRLPTGSPAGSTLAGQGLIILLDQRRIKVTMLETSMDVKNTFFLIKNIYIYR